MHVAAPQDARLTDWEHYSISFNGWRLTMVDSLDTMLVMGLHDEFDRSIPVLANMTFALDEVRGLRWTTRRELTHELAMTGRVRTIL